MGWLRLAFFMYVGLTIIYFVTGIYSRSSGARSWRRNGTPTPPAKGVTAEERAPSSRRAWSGTTRG
jgi:hypothetical protein